MNQFERVDKIDRLLRSRVHPATQRMLDDCFRASQWRPDQELEELSGGAALPRVPDSQD